MEVGGARLGVGGARRLRDPPGPELFVPVSTRSPLLVSPSFHFPRDPPDLLHTSGQSPC